MIQFFDYLSPLLQIFFGIPDSKKFKTEIHSKIKNKKIDELEFLFLKFVNQQNELVFS